MITLINPFITSKERYGRDIAAIGGHQAPLGLCYLAANLRKNGIEASLIDAEKERLSNNAVINRLNSLKPDAVGITATTVAFERARSLAGDIKLFNPAIPVIIGGPHVTANPGDTMGNEGFDYGVMREGEITLLELARALKENKPVENISGIAYRKGTRVIVSPPRPYIDNLDSLPFPSRELLPDPGSYLPPLGCYLKTPVISVITSRGCPYECIFCDKNVFGKSVRYHSPDYVVREIEHAADAFGAREIFFLDDTFTINQDRVRKILYLMKKKKVRMTWSCMTNVNNLSESLIREMKEAGCWQISIGAESGNQGVLDFIKKKTKLAKIKDAVAWSRRAGMYVKGFFMLGHPIDTPETIDETIRFAKSVPFDDVVVTIATPMPGTEFYSMAPGYGTLRVGDWRGFSYWRSVFTPRALSEKSLYSKQSQFYKEFYLRPRPIVRQLMKMRSISRPLRYGTSIGKLILESIVRSGRGRLPMR